MNPIAMHPVPSLTPPPVSAMAQALDGAARVFARIAVALRRAAATRRHAGRAHEPHVGERVALGTLNAHLLRDIGASPSLLARAAEAARERAPERVLAGLY